MKWFETTKGSCKYPGPNCPGRSHLYTKYHHGRWCKLHNGDAEVEIDVDPEELKRLEEEHHEEEKNAGK
jgi:hypothetical protein